MTYTLRIWYAGSLDEDPQVHTGLSRFEAETGLGAFSRDAFGLEGRGVRKLELEVEVQE